MSSSSYPGERRRGPGNAAVLVAVLFLIVFPALHGGGGRAGAMRTFPPTPMAIPKKPPTQTTLFRQYFSSRSDENDEISNICLEIVSIRGLATVFDGENLGYTQEKGGKDRVALNISSSTGNLS
nr:hypothetical protein Iba_chr07bCG14860 [Ipomoea batatas]